MGYRKAEQILPTEVIELIQTYIDGECIYIPRKENKRHAWGEKTSIRTELSIRNEQIYHDYQSGEGIKVLAEKYYLSEKSIQRIIYTMKQHVS